MFHRIVMFIRRFVDAIRHIRSGGQTTRARAVRRASAPPRRCTECMQPVPHVEGWSDHHDVADWKDRISRA